MIHAAESTHWYSRDGLPAYEVKAKAGHMRPTTLADARKQGYVPGVSTILQCAARPGLERWKAHQLMLAALTLPRIPGELEADWLKRVMDDSQAQSKKAAERGTAIHAAIQGHFEGEPPSPDFYTHCRAANDVVADWFSGEWVAEESFAHPLGFGGKVDLHCRGYVLDFKTKEFDQNDEMQTWDEQHMQLAAYCNGLGMPTARSAIVYVSTTVPGLARLVEIQNQDLAKGWKCFYSLLHFWQAKTGYTSAFDRLAA